MLTALLAVLRHIPIDPSTLAASSRVLSNGMVQASHIRKTELNHISVRFCLGFLVLTAFCPNTLLSLRQCGSMKRPPDFLGIHGVHFKDSVQLTYYRKDKCCNPPFFNAESRRAAQPQKKPAALCKKAAAGGRKQHKKRGKNWRT